MFIASVHLLKVISEISIFLGRMGSVTRATKDTFAISSDAKGKYTSEIDVLKSDGRDVPQHFGIDHFRILLLPILEDAVQMVGIPGHGDIGEQGQGPGCCHYGAAVAT